MKKRNRASYKEKDEMKGGGDGKIRKDDTERERVRRKKRKKAFFSFCLAIIVLVIVGGFGYVLAEKVIDYLNPIAEEKSNEDEPRHFDVEIINENRNTTISSRISEYIDFLAGDLKDYDLELLRVVLPADKTREIDVDIEGVKPFFRVSIDRGSAVTAEDISRMIKYLIDNGLIDGITYVDVRVGEKAFYK